MRKCIVCNETMYRKNESKPYNFKNCFRHEEHIIQNALGGRLKSYEVLCESCGGKVNDTIDSDFIKLFSLYTAGLNDLIERDREMESSVKSKGYHKRLDIDISYSDGKLIPIKPKFEYDPLENKLYVYAFERIMEDYVKKAVSDTQKKTGLTDFEVVRCMSFEPSEEIELFFSKGNINFNSQLAKGLTKIAVEYAYKEGVDRAELLHHIDEVNKTFRECKLIYMFMPPTQLLYILDYFRDLLDENFPNHALMLYTIDYGPMKRYLYCYIELFGTFQYYVTLSDNYKGERLNTSFAQRLQSKVKVEINFDEMQFKELYSFARLEDIDISAHDYEIEILRGYIKKQYDRKFSPYIYDLKENVRSQISELQRIITRQTVGYTTDNLLYSYLEKMPSGFKVNLILELLEKIKNADSTKEFYRQVISPSGDELPISMAAEVCDNYLKDKKAFIEFGHYKAKILYSFITDFLRTRNKEKKAM